jgi:hypothetical protein
MREIGNVLFPLSEGYTPKDSISKYEPIIYFDKNDPPFFYGTEGRMTKFQCQYFLTLLTC